MNNSIKMWYLMTYPSDEMGYAIDDSVTFDDLYTTLDSGEDIYELMDVHDSLIRERVFGRLSELMGVDYAYVYRLWLSK